MAEGGNLTISEAVKAGWASRPTIYRLIKTGKISISKDVAGRSYVDVSELVRVFGEPKRRDGKGETEPLSARLIELEADNARLRAERDALAKADAEAKERETWLRGQLDAQMRLIASQTPPEGFWRRLLRRTP